MLLIEEMSEILSVDETTKRCRLLDCQSSVATNQRKRSDHKNDEKIDWKTAASKNHEMTDNHSQDERSAAVKMKIEYNYLCCQKDVTIYWRANCS